MTIFWLVSAWVIGLASANATRISGGPPAWIALTAAGFGGLLITRIGAARRRWWRVGFACALCFALGGLRMVSAAHTPTPADLDYYNNRGIVTLEGVIDDMPVPIDSGLRFRVAVESIAGQGAIRGMALVQTSAIDLYQPLQYGDRVRIIGEPQTPADFGGGRYQAALARSGIYTTIYHPGLAVTARGQGNPLLAIAFAQRVFLYRQFLSLLPMPQAALLSGIVLGADQGLPPEVQDAFQATGASHIVAISGANISVVAALLLLILGGIRPRWVGTLLLIGALAAYTVFVGASPSVIRAALMAALSLIAQRTGRRGWGLATLALTVLIQSVFSPLVIYDAGFALSALATLGILIYLPPFEGLSRVISSWMRPRWLSQAAGALLAGVMINLAVQVTTLPVQLALAGNASPLAVIVNALVVPAQPAIMVLGLACAGAALIWLPVAQVAAWLAYLPTAYTLWIIRRGADLIGTLPAITLEPGALLAYYAALIYLTGSALLAARGDQTGTLSNRRPTTRGLRRVMARTIAPLLRVGGVAAAILTWGAALGLPDRQAHVWLLPVGEPGAALIRTPNGGTVLIDGGSSADKLSTALGDTLPFLQTHIDLLILTAPAIPKSYAGLAASNGPVARYRVGRVALLGVPPDDADLSVSATRTFTALRQNLRDTPWVTVNPGDSVRATDDLWVRFEADSIQINYQQARITLPIGGKSALLTMRHDGTATLSPFTGDKPTADDRTVCSPIDRADGSRSYRPFVCPLLEIRTDGQSVTLTR